MKIERNKLTNDSCYKQDGFNDEMETKQISHIYNIISNEQIHNRYGSSKCSLLLYFFQFFFSFGELKRKDDTKSIFRVC